MNAFQSSTFGFGKKVYVPYRNNIVYHSTCIGIASNGIITDANIAIIS